MALMDYRKLCPQSGHVLTLDQRAELRTREPAGGAANSVQCEICGRTVGVGPDPGSGQSLIYSMHLRDCAGHRHETARRPR
jgi:hypothetical protein